jgi:CHAD domain-containing protein
MVLMAKETERRFLVRSDKWRTKAGVGVQHLQNQNQQKPNTKYYLRRGEKLPDGVRRILNEQISAAIDELSNERSSLENSVHEARRCVKRSRSLLRLVRQAIGRAYARENCQLQSAGRKLSALRDATALIETLQDLDKRRPAAKRAENGTRQQLSRDFRDAYHFLCDRKDKIAGQMRASGDISSVVEQMERARRRIERLPLKNMEFAVIVDSLKTSMRRGNRAFSKAYADPQPENFHEYRKRVKDLRYQLRLVTKMWPGVREGYADSAKDLEQVLGGYHNLAVLADVLREENGRNGGSSALLSAIEKAQMELRDKAKKLGHRLYSEPIKAWTRRLESSWRAWEAKGEK